VHWHIGTQRHRPQREAVWLWPKRRAVVREQRKSTATCPVCRTVLVGVESAPALACCTARRSRPKRVVLPTEETVFTQQTISQAVVLRGRAGLRRVWWRVKMRCASRPPAEQRRRVASRQAAVCSVAQIGRE
jgi:hypothetical protein